jgi:alginate O-acetyltransferase complex protein AlgI
MLFNSVEFGIFFIVFFSIYWTFFKNRFRAQNVFILLASLFFYGCWNSKFLLLIVASIAVDYTVGIGMETAQKLSTKKKYLALSLITNLGLLVTFKYFNFFIESAADLIGLFGLQANITSLNLILPVGISFYTFQTLGYSIDVYHGKIKASRNLITFGSYVSFFPQLVAGPIERAKHLLPQFNTKRKFDVTEAKHGCRQILWGLFKKVIVADSCAVNANYIFENYENLHGSILILGAFYFAFQIYGDFSGYSDIAIGTARLLGFNLMINFKTPYLSTSIVEFWQRWHISLSTWFRDYVYIPLGGNRKGTARTITNIFIIFLVSGFWHGANYTFIAWGTINAIWFIPYYLLGKKTNNKPSPWYKTTAQVVVTFSVVCLAWIFFRSENILDAFQYIKQIFTAQLFTIPGHPSLEKTPLYWVVILMFFELLYFKQPYQFTLANIAKPIRWLIYYLVIWLILFYGQEKVSFIYFQF